MLRTFWIPALLALAVSSFAQTTTAVTSCQATPGQTNINVELYDTSMEPRCQPARIRVADRTAVILRIKGISPLEVCGITPKAQTLTTVTNPLDSIFGTIAAYKNFPIGESAARKPAAVVGGPPVDPILTAFYALSNQVIPTGNTVIAKQNSALKQYTDDITFMNDYVTKPYRGKGWSTFDPENAATLQQVKNDSNFPKVLQDGITTVPSELDWAPLQALIDQMKTLQPRLIANCSTPAPSAPATCDTAAQKNLFDTATDIERATSIMTLLQDNLKSLQTQQAAIAAAFTALKKIKTDFDARVRTGVVKKDPETATKDSQELYTTIILGRDYGTTDTGTISCTTTTAPAVPTTDAMNYTVLYQNVPALTVSTGILLTFLPKYEYGVVSTLDQGSVNLGATPPAPGTFTNYFAQTDYARASVFPMAFVNYRLFKPYLKSWWSEPNSELVITNNVSAGIGVNPNTGTNQTEYFVGYAVGFSRALVHFGEHWGRQESLGGGFTVGNPVPTGWTSSNTVPINWKYQHYFAMGFSVRIAPF
jgi:hypothetical protein